MVGKKFWDRLTPDEQQILQDSCVEARDYQRKVNRESNTKVLAELKAKGMTFNEIPPEEMAKMREKVRPVIDKYTKEVGEDLVKQTYAEIEKVRKQK
jgi:TRAP-type C4-dicarboxylate transport system substrate-binding protein